MSTGILERVCPSAPSWKVDWGGIEDAIPLVRTLRGCPQDPVHHAEGDVWTHTRMVCEWLAASEAWQRLDEGHRQIVFAAAVLHDTGKPARTRVDDAGRVVSPGHAPEGERLARRLLWELGVHLEAREHVAALVRDHGRPLWAILKPDPERGVIESSCRLDCGLLGLLAEADARGRECADTGDLMDRIAMYREFVEELGVADQAFAFANDRSRAEYFRRPGRDPRYAAFDDSWGEVIVMSGLPAAGKTTLVDRRYGGLPVVRLDDIRDAQDIDPGEPQGAVVRAAQERAKGFLRERRPFVWDATNLSRDVRSSVTDLMAAYGARVRIEYVEVSRERMLERNAGRASPIPSAAVERMLRRWEVPYASEAEVVCRTVSGA